MANFSNLDYIAILNFVFIWFFYAAYARKMSEKRNSLMQITKSLRLHWILKSVQNDSTNRIVDIQLMNLLQRGVTFFISTTIFIIAGFIAVLGSGDIIVILLSQLPYSANNISTTWTIKIIMIIIIFVVAFFRLTWSLRQNHYGAIAMVGAPQCKSEKKEEKYILANKVGSLITSSGDNFNNAIRIYYYSLASLTWLFHPVVFIFTTMLVMLILYRREFLSRALENLTDVNNTYNSHSQ